MLRALPIMLLAVMASPASAGETVDCALAVNPAPGWPGANLVVGGERFPPGADFTVSIGFFPMYDGFIADDGTFEITFRVPTPFDLGPTELTVVDHTGVCTMALAYEIGAPPPEEPAIAPWGLAVFAAVGAALGVGVVGVLLRRR
jgi:hypothetical protein